jgi:hypothetical protein
MRSRELETRPPRTQPKRLLRNPVRSTKHHHLNISASHQKLPVDALAVSTPEISRNNSTLETAFIVAGMSYLLLTSVNAAPTPQAEQGSSLQHEPTLLEQTEPSLPEWASFTWSSVDTFTTTPHTIGDPVATSSISIANFGSGTVYGPASVAMTQDAIAMTTGLVTSPAIELNTVLDPTSSDISATSRVSLAMTPDVNTPSSIELNTAMQSASSDIPTIIPATATPTTTFNPLHLILPAGLLVIGAGLWLFFRIRRNKRRRQGVPPLSTSMSYKPCDGDDRSYRGSTDCNPLGIPQALDQPYSLKYNWQDTCSSHTGRSDRSEGSTPGATPGHPMQTYARLSREHCRFLRQSDSVKPPKIIIQASTPDSTWKRIRFTQNEEPTSPKKRSSPWKRIFKRSKDAVEPRVDDGESCLAGKPYGSMGHSETGASPRFLTRPAVIETRSIVSQCDDIPRLTYTVTSEPPIDLTISSGDTSHGSDSPPEPAGSPVLSALSQYSTVSTLIPSYYYSPLAATMARTGRQRTVPKAAMSPLMEQDVATVAPLTSVLDGLSSVPLIIRPENQRQISNESCVSVGLLEGFADQESPPIEGSGLRIVTETPSPPVCITASTITHEGSSYFTIKPSQAPSTPTQIPRDEARLVSPRKTMRGPRLLIRKNPDRKEIEYVSPSIEVTPQTAIPEEGSRRSRKKKHGGHHRSIRTPTGGRPAPSHVKRHSTAHLSDIFALPDGAKQTGDETGPAPTLEQEADRRPL